MRAIMKVHREGMRLIFGVGRGKAEATDSKHNPEKTEPTSMNMEPEAELREVPKEEAGGLKKRRRDRNLAAERLQKPKERTR
jgi:hypothetical protein